MHRHKPREIASVILGTKIPKIPIGFSAIATQPGERGYLVRDEQSPQLPAMLSLLDLPNELFLEIAKNLDKFGLKNLLEVCDHLGALLIPLLEGALLRDPISGDQHQLQDFASLWPCNGTGSKEAFSSCTTLSTHNVSAILWAVEEGFQDLAEILVKNGTDITDASDVCQCTPLHRAVLSHNEEMTVFLLSHGAEADVYDNGEMTPFGRAVEFGAEEILRIFLDHGCDPDWIFPGSLTALQIAALDGNENIAKLLLGAGAIVDLRSNGGKTALHYAANPGCGVESAPVVRLLLEEGADVTTMDDQGDTPLHWAVCGNLRDQEAVDDAIEIIQLLLDHGADVSAENESGTTALHSMASGDYGTQAEHAIEVISVLLENGAYLGAQDHAGQTALHKAAATFSADYPGVFDFLLDQGASPLTRDYSRDPLIGGCNALDMIDLDVGYRIRIERDHPT